MASAPERVDRRGVVEGDRGPFLVTGSGDSGSAGDGGITLGGGVGSPSATRV